MVTTIFEAPVRFKRFIGFYRQWRKNGFTPSMCATMAWELSRLRRN